MKSIEVSNPVSPDVTALRVGGVTRIIVRKSEQTPDALLRWYKNCRAAELGPDVWREGIALVVSATDSSAVEARRRRESAELARFMLAELAGEDMDRTDAALSH